MKNSLQRMDFMQTYIIVSLHNRNNNRNKIRQWNDNSLHWRLFNYFSFYCLYLLFPHKNMHLTFLRHCWSVQPFRGNMQ